MIVTAAPGVAGHRRASPGGKQERLARGIPNGIMQNDCTSPVSYKRSRFSSRLPADRLYTPSHFWLLEIDSGVWRVGFTKFATRMLGDLVEHTLNAKPGDRVTVGQEIGWVEGFKALTDLYCVLDGEFLGTNPALERDPTLTDRDPYGEGWLYTARGTPEPNSVDVHGYTQLLDLTIDKMQEKVGDARAAGGEGAVSNNG